MKWDLLLPLHFPQVAPLIFGVRGRLSCQGWQQARSYLNGGSVSKGKQHQRFVRGVTSSVTGVELSVRHTGFKCAKWFPQVLLGCSRAEGTCPVLGLTCVGWRAWPWAHNPGAHPCSVSVPGRDPWAYSSHSGCSLLRLAESLALHQRKGPVVQSAQHLLFPLARARGRTWLNLDARPSGEPRQTLLGAGSSAGLGDAPTAPSRSQLFSVGSGGKRSLPSTTSHGGKQSRPLHPKPRQTTRTTSVSRPFCGKTTREPIS